MFNAVTTREQGWTVDEVEHAHSGGVDPDLFPEFDGIDSRLIGDWGAPDQ